MKETSNLLSDLGKNLIARNCQLLWKKMFTLQWHGHALVLCDRKFFYKYDHHTKFIIKIDFLFQKTLYVFHSQNHVQCHCSLLLLKPSKPKLVICKGVVIYYSGQYYKLSFKLVLKNNMMFIIKVLDTCPNA